MDETPNSRAPRVRHDGWTLERQAIFLATLERTGTVHAAATAAGMNRASAYRLRDRPDGRRFSRAWDNALLRRRERLLEARLAKATLPFGRRRDRDEGDTPRWRAALGKSGKSDTCPRFAPHGQSGQDCRVPRRDPALLRALIEAACGDSAFPLEGGSSNA
jgi:hypothetical protein